MTTPKTKRADWPKVMHFDVKFYRDGEWTAQCREVDGLFTGGHLGETIYDATMAAMGLKEIPEDMKIVIALPRRKKVLLNRP